METRKTIIDMVSRNLSAYEIAKATNLTMKQLFYQMTLLEMKGYSFNKKYYSSGDIIYDLNNTTDDKSVALITKPGENKIPVLLLSDLHLGSVLDAVPLLNEVYNLCEKEGIHIILNGGDIIESFLGHSDKRYHDALGQVDYFLANYPFASNILNFICLGNHDKDLLDTAGVDISKTFASYRHDIIPLGLGKGKLRIKNDEIYFKHLRHSSRCEENLSGLILAGHSHLFKYIVMPEFTKIVMPSLSYITHDECPFPSFIKAMIYFENGIIVHINAKHYLFTDGQMFQAGEASLQVNSTKKDNDNLEEIRTRSKGQTLTLSKK